MQNEKKYWFPAKRYGWGWGLPSMWQGWMVLIVYVILLGIGYLAFRPREEPAHFIIYVNCLSVLLVVVCWLKGEPPHWRWGRK